MIGKNFGVIGRIKDLVYINLVWGWEWVGR